METRIAKSEHFEATSILEPSSHCVKLSLLGDLNEEARLDELAAYLSRLPPEVDLVEFNLGGVRQVNSAGIRQWLNFMKIRPAHQRFLFVKVSEPLVDQINLIPDLLGPSINAVLSVFAPYICESCNSRNQIEICLKTPGPPGLESRPCPRCGEMANLDGLPTEYFGFAKELAG